MILSVQSEINKMSFILIAKRTLSLETLASKQKTVTAFIFIITFLQNVRNQLTLKKKTKQAYCLHTGCLENF